MKWRKHATSIVLIALAVGLSAYVWLVDRDKVTDTEREARARDILPAFRRDALSRIEIVSGSETLVLARDVAADSGDAPWRIEKPVPQAADPDAVDHLVGALEFASYVRKLEGKAPGTDTPRARITVTMGKLVFHLALGSAAPSPAGASYLSVEGEGAYVVSKELTDQLLLGADAYRSRTVVPYLSLDLTSLEVRGKTSGFHVDRMDDVSFRLAGSKLRASRQVIDRVWQAFADMRAESFLPDADADRLTAAPAFTITMTPKDASKPKGVMVVGDACPGHPDDVAFVRTEPTRVSACVPKGVLAGLGTTAAELVDPRLFVAHEDEVEEITLETLPSGTRVELARKGSGWHERSPADRDLEGDEVDMANALVGAVVRSEGTDAKEDAAPLAARARVTLVRAETHAREVVELGGDAAHPRVHRDADGATLSVSPEVARKLTPSLVALKGRAVFLPSLDARDAKTLSLRCGVAQDLEAAGSQWTLRAPHGFAADPPKTLDMVDQLAKLQADAWVADHDDGSFGFATSPCSVTLTLGFEGGTRTVTVRLGREGEGGVYAQAEDAQPGRPKTLTPVFLLPRTMRDLLQTILVDRSPVTIDTARADRIEVERPGAAVVLTQVAGQWTGPDAGLPAGPDALLHAVDTLRADEVAHLGAPAADEGFATPSLQLRATVTADGGARTTHLVFGRDTVRHNLPMVFARVDGIDATFLVARDRVSPIRDSF